MLFVFVHEFIIYKQAVFWLPLCLQRVPNTLTLKLEPACVISFKVPGMLSYFFEDYSQTYAVLVSGSFQHSFSRITLLCIYLLYLFGTGSSSSSSIGF